MSQTGSSLDRARAGYRPRLPPILSSKLERIAVEPREVSGASAGLSEIREHFPRSHGQPALELVEGRGTAQVRPLVVGVVLSGGQAPGGHNVIAGLFDGLQAIHGGSRLVGFLGGPGGVLNARSRELDASSLEPFRNTGGFDLLGSGRDKIETPDQLAACEMTCEKLGLAVLVVVGGDDSNTNAATLAEHFLARGRDVSVLGVPKTIDGDLKGGGVEASFGFDTATKIYSELIGNICRDARSAGKYWHFVRLMGRSASHVTLECALQTHPNIALIGEEVEEKQQTLSEVVDPIADLVRLRAEAGKRHGVVLVPEGLIEFIPEMRALIAELNRFLARQAGDLESLGSFDEKERLVGRELAGRHAEVFQGLPDRIRQQLLIDRDSHGNVQVSQIDTELLLIGKVRERLAGKFQALGHFFGYEGRAGQPSNFDADYTYALGRLAAVLAAYGKTGYVCGIQNLAGDPSTWKAVGVPLTALMRMELRKGKPAPVIAKALVRTDREPFRTFAAARGSWALEDDYLYPGAIQYFGPPEVCDAPTRTLQLEHPARAR